MLSVEKYGFDDMVARRRAELERNRLDDPDLHVGVILGILGRQGSPLILERVKAQLRERQTK